MKSSPAIVALIVAAAIALFFVFGRSAKRAPETPTGPPGVTSSPFFHGPTAAPSIKGPSGPPPNY